MTPLYLFGCISLLFGVVSFRSWRTQRKTLEGMYRWVSADARLISSELKEMRFKRGGGVWWKPKIIYEYVVMGNRYTGKVIRESTSARSESREAAQSVLDGVSSMRPLRIYYDPDAPDHAVIYREDPKSANGTLAYAIFWLVLGASLLGFAFSGASVN